MNKPRVVLKTFFIHSVIHSHWSAVYPVGAVESVVWLAMAAHSA